MKLIDKDKLWNKYKLYVSPEIIVATWFICSFITLVLTGNSILTLFVCAIIVAITTWLEIKYSEHIRKK